MAKRRTSYQAKPGFKRSSWSVDRLSDARLAYLKALYAKAFDCPHVSNTTIVRRALQVLAEYLPSRANEGDFLNERRMLDHAKRIWLSPWGNFLPDSLRNPETGKFLTFTELSRREIGKRKEIVDLLTELPGEKTNDI